MRGAPGKQRGRADVSERGPDHIAVNAELDAAKRQHDALREVPQHADETDEQQRRLQQTDAEIGREFGKMVGVLVDALIGIDADRSRPGDEKGAPGRQPLRDQVTRQALA